MRWTELNKIVEEHIKKGTDLSLRLIWRAAGQPEQATPELFVSSNPFQVLMTATGHYYQERGVYYATPTGLREYMQFLKANMEDV